MIFENIWLDNKIEKCVCLFKKETDLSRFVVSEKNRVLLNKKRTHYCNVNLLTMRRHE